MLCKGERLLSLSPVSSALKLSLHPSSGTLVQGGGGRILNVNGDVNFARKYFSKWKTFKKGSVELIC